MLDASRIDPADPWLGGHGAASTIALVAQPEIERILAERAAALGVEVRRGVEVTGLDQHPDGVRVELGGSGSAVECGWLVGADGGRSVVRRAAGFDFVGTDPEITGHQAVVETSGHEALRPGWNVTGTGVYLNGPMPGRILTVEFDGPPADRDGPVDAAELQSALRRTSGVDVTVHRVVTATRWTGVLLDPSGSHAAERVPVIRSGSADRPDLKGLLVRPDGVVVWAGEDGALPAALRTWFG